MNKRIKTYWSSTNGAALWMLCERIVRIVSGLLISVVFARELGVEDFGFLSFCVAVMLLLNPITSMSIQSVITKAIVDKPDKEAEVIGSILSFQVILSSFLVLGIIFLYSLIQEVSLGVFVLIQAILVFKSFEILLSSFEAHSKMSIIAKNQIIVVLCFLAIKLFVVHFGANLLLVALVLTLESAAHALIYFWLYSKYCQKFRYLKINYNTIQYYFKKSLPLIVSSFATLGYMKIDQIMIAKYISIESNGLYSVAVRISEFSVFLPQIILILVFPKLVKLRKKNVGFYRRKISRVLFLLNSISVFMGGLIFLISDYLIALLFGSEYAESASLLKIHLFGLIFVFMGFFSNYIYIIEEKENRLVWRSLMGLILNVTLNYLLISRYGISGAAIATVFTQFFVSFTFEIFNEDMRWLFQLKLKSLVYKL